MPRTLPPGFIVHPKYEDGMNIYTMFRANDKELPFWVSKWRSQVLRVTEIETLQGRPPYYGNAPVSGEILSIYQDDKRTDTYRKIEERVVSAGTFNWIWVEPHDAKIVL